MAEDVLFTVLANASTRTTFLNRILQDGFANPIPLHKHIKGQSYLTELLEASYVQSSGSKAHRTRRSANVNDNEDTDSRSDESYLDEDGSEAD